MSLVGALVGARSTPTPNNIDHWYGAFGEHGESLSGERVSHRAVLGLPAYWRGVTLRADLVGMMPCKVYKTNTADPQALFEADHASRVWTLLHDLPNSAINLTADEYWSIVEGHVATWGNHFSWKEYGGDSRIANLWPIDPWRVQTGVIKGNNGQYVRVFTIDGVAYSSKEILHFRGLSGNGAVGYSPLQLHRQAFGAELARQRFKARFWKNGAMPGIALIHPNEIKPDAIKRIKSLWDSHQRGPDNAGRTAVLGENIKVQELTMPLADAQFVQQAQLAATEIAHILKLPASKLGGMTGDSMTYTSVQAESVDLLKFSLTPSLTRYQNVVTMDPDLMPAGYYARFDPSAILATTDAERFAAHNLEKWKTVDEVRGDENMGPLADGTGDVLMGRLQQSRFTITEAVPGTSVPAADTGQNSLKITTEYDETGDGVQFARMVPSKTQRALPVQRRLLTEGAE